MSLRNDIRDNIAIALASPATTIGTILSGRRDDIPDAQVTAGYALVYYVRESAQPEGRNPWRTRLHDATFNIEVHVAAAATLTQGGGASPTAAADALQTAEAALDAHLDAIETAVHTDLTRGGNAITSACSGAEYAFFEDGTRVYGTLTVPVQVLFRTNG